MARPPHPAVTNRSAQPTEGMTLRELIRFVTDCLQAPIPVDQDAPLHADTALGGRLRALSAPLVPCTCPRWPAAGTPLHHPSCPHRIVSVTA